MATGSKARLEAGDGAGAIRLPEGAEVAGASLLAHALARHLGSDPQAHPTAVLVSSDASLAVGEKARRSLASALSAAGVTCLDAVDVPPCVLSHAVRTRAGALAVRLSRSDEGGCEATVLRADGYPMSRRDVRSLVATRPLTAPSGHPARIETRADAIREAYLDALTAQCVPPRAHDLRVRLSGPDTPMRDLVRDALTREGVTIVRDAGDEGTCEIAFGLDEAGRLRIGVTHGTRLVPLTTGELAEIVLGMPAGVGYGRPDAAGSLVVATLAESGLLDAVCARDAMQLVRTLPQEAALLEEASAAEGRAPAAKLVLATGAHVLLTADSPARVEDAATCALLACRAASWHKEGGRDLIEALDALHEADGWYLSATSVVPFESVDDAALALMRLRSDDVDLICHMMVSDTHDLLGGIAMPGSSDRTLPATDALAWTLSDGSDVLAAADGPDVRLYVRVRGDTEAEARVVLEAMMQDAHRIITYA